jgi:hypothetical protein
MTQTTRSATTNGRTRAEVRHLMKLRDRFGVDHDLFDQRELARLRFVRWLVRTGRVRP